jgi:hypothetical protein
MTRRLVSHTRWGKRKDKVYGEIEVFYVVSVCFLFVEVIWKNQPQQQPEVHAECPVSGLAVASVCFSEVHKATSSPVFAAVQAHTFRKQPS